jgi:hypothetical protein
MDEITSKVLIFLIYHKYASFTQLSYSVLLGIKTAGSGQLFCWCVNETEEANKFHAENSPYCLCIRLNFPQERECGKHGENSF